MHAFLKVLQAEVENLDKALESSPWDYLGRKQELTLGQIDALVELLQENEWVKERYNTDFRTLSDLLEYITQKQKRYIQFLVFEKKYLKLGEILNQLKIPKI